MSLSNRRYARSFRNTALTSILPTALFSSLLLLPSFSSTSAAQSDPDDTYSDFNGDGYDDLAIGVPGENVGTVEEAGAVNVLYGSSSGLRSSTAGDGTGRADQFWHQNSPGVLNTAEGGDGFGTSLAAGDFNGDGKDDLAIGATGEDIGNVGDAGAVNVLYGSSSGLQATSPQDQFWHQGQPGVEDAEEGNERFGFSLAAGDFNNDGFDDLAIGVVKEDIGTIPGAGAVHVLYGSSSGLQTTSPADQFWHEDSPGVEDAVEFGVESFGASLAAGDYDNDGFDDLAIGVPGERTGKGSAGAVHVLYGSATGLQTISPAAQFWHQGKPGVEDVEETNDRFGSSLAAGDFNNDGFDDLAIGVVKEDIGTIPGAGAVNVLYGSSSGLQATSPPDQFWHQNIPSVEGSSGKDARFGWPLAAGDFNDDGRDDLAIGATGEVLGGGFRTGAVHVLYGSATGLQTTSPTDQFWHQNSPGVQDSAEDDPYVDGGELFGSSLAAGDFNGDGRDDLAIGVPQEDIGTIRNAGAVNVLYGSAVSGLQTSSPADQFWHQNSPGVQGTAEEIEVLGWSLG